ncbi:uncharacterized protein LOC142326863 [Lycorma delicatula]|uniref:uncharacterized protein LOC142326863 n=1 Tax=Lycorma delicatula TaxID=130591 RepID=UPI003F514352
MSSILYAAPVWGTAMNVQRNKRKLRSVHRVALIRVVSGYRTISYDALCVLAETPPIELQIKGRSMRAAGVPRAEVEDTVVSNWQTAVTAQTGEWTRRLFPI